MSPALTRYRDAAIVVLGSSALLTTRSRADEPGRIEEMVARVIRPVLMGSIPLARGIDAVASARTAALTDPEGETLARCLAQIEPIRDLGIAAE